MVLLMSIPCALAQQRENVAARLERSAELIRSGRMPEAESELTAVLKIAPNEADALNLLGTIRAQQDRLKEAETLFQRALRLNSKLISAHMNLAYLYLLEGAPENAISQLREIVRLDPSNVEAAYKLARALMSQGHVDDCISFAESRIQSPGRQVNPFLLTVLGDAYFKKGDADKAAEAYQRALSLNGDDQNAALGLVRIAHLKGDASTAGLYLSRARQIAADSPDLLYRFVVAALEIGSDEEAKSALELAIRLKPQQASYFTALGAAWLKKPDLFEAERAFRRAIELEPGNAQDQMYLGYTLLKQKKYSEAGAYLEKSVAAESGNAEPFYYLGLVAQEQNDDQRAIRFLEKAVQLAPSYSIAHVALGTSYLKLKDYPRAQQELEMAERMDPDEPKAHYQLALLYARLKDPARAQNEMRIVEKLKDRGIVEGQQSDTPSTPARNPL
jgi:tetratricopeptide (TPR) repeat protein